MAYIKLNEVEIVNSSIDSNVLIEENGEIKRMPVENLAVSQVQADWNETDPTKPSFIMNKPESLGGGSGGKVIVFSGSSGSYRDTNGNVVSAQTVIDEWNVGSILRIAKSDRESNVISIVPSYWYNSATANDELSSVRISYFDGSTISTETVY